MLHRRHHTKSHFRELLAGGCGGTCMVVTGYPLDTVKVRLQTMPKPPAGQPPLYTGTLDCMRKIVKREGVRGLFRGMMAPILGVSPMFAVNFFGFGLGVRLQQHHADHCLRVDEVFRAGMLAGVFTTFVITPVDRVKCLLQTPIEGGQRYTGSLDCARQLVRAGGLRSLYKGLGITSIRDVLGGGIFFTTYELLRKWLSSPDAKAELNIGVTLLAGGVTGLTFWGCVLPADTIKSRYQTAPEGVYSNARQAFATLVREEGAGALYRGAAPVLLRAFPATGACFLGYEFAVQFLHWAFPHL